MTKRILAINPGSTSTKIAVYDDETIVFELTLRHTADEVGQFEHIVDQKDFRRALIMDALVHNNVALDSLHAIVGRGGLLRPMRSGTYRVSEPMLEDLRSAKYGQHASNLGAIIASDIATQLHLPAFIVDPVVVDELSNLARLSGLPGHERTSIFHALNQKAVARKVAKDRNRSIEDCNFIVCHMGGGISVGAHEKGSVIDVNNALIGEGPYSPERTGGLPLNVMLDLCYGNKTLGEVKKLIAGKGGLVAYLHTNDGREVNQRIQAGDEYAKLVYEGMAYQIAKEIGIAATVLKGKIDAIILTGGLAYDDLLVGWIKERVSFLGDIVLVPGEDEMMALTQGVLRVLRHEEEPMSYS